MATPMMPMATAVWLVDNTSLTFVQIGDFCGLHELEVQGIADGTVGQHIVGLDPIAQNQLTAEELERCQKDSNAELRLKTDAIETKRRTKGPRYTPVSKRQDKPDAIAWLLRHHPELSDAQIGRLVGTTKPTIQAIRDRTHWNASNIKPVDPVALGLCKQIELDEAVAKAAARLPKVEAEALPADEEVLTPVTAPEPSPVAPADEPSVESVFGPQPSSSHEGQ